MLCASSYDWSRILTSSIKGTFYFSIYSTETRTFESCESFSYDWRVSIQDKNGLWTFTAKDIALWSHITPRGVLPKYFQSKSFRCWFVCLQQTKISTRTEISIQYNISAWFATNLILRQNSVCWGSRFLSETKIFLNQSLYEVVNCFPLGLWR